MGHCKDCRSWESNTTCNEVGWVAIDANIGDGDMAIYADADDDQGLDAGLKTGPMFGCVNFQPRARRHADSA